MCVCPTLFSLSSVRPFTHPPNDWKGLQGRGKERKVEQSGEERKSWKQFKICISFLCSRCSFSMMVKWANDGLLQANDGKMLFNDGEILVNDGEMSVWSYTQFTLIEYFTIINKHFTIINDILPSFAHLTIIEKLHRLLCGSPCSDMEGFVAPCNSSKVNY